MIGAALSEATAKFVGGWADGMVTVGGDPSNVRKMIDAFRRGGGEGKPVFLQHVLSWAPNDAEALRQAHEQWRFSALKGDVLAVLRTPKQFADATRYVRPEDMADSVRISSDLGQHAEWIAAYEPLGVERVMLMNAGLNQRAFIEAFGKGVLPQLA